MSAAAKDSKELGTIVTVVLKARNLPDKHTFTKQDPYAVVQLGSCKAQTKVDKRGGQHPIWDEDLRIKVLTKDTKDNRIMKVSCYAKEPKEDVLIGVGEIDISETLESGEFDDWVKLEQNGAYRGEVYLEMTFFAAGPPPLARRASKMAPSERLWRPPQASPKTSAQTSPYNSPPSRYPAELAPSAQTSSRPSNFAPPRSSRSQSPSSRFEAPLPPVPEEVPASLLPAPIRTNAGKAASTNTSPKTGPVPIPAALRPGGSGRPVAASQQSQAQRLRTSSVPTSPTNALQQLQPMGIVGSVYQSPYELSTVPSGYVAPTTQPVHSPTRSDYARHPSVSSSTQPVYNPPQTDFARHPSTSPPNQPAYLPPQSNYGAYRPVSPAYPPHQSVSPAYGPHRPTSPPNQQGYLTAQGNYAPYPPASPYQRSVSPYSSYDPSPLSYTSSPSPSPGVISTSMPPPSGSGSLNLAFPEPNVSGPGYPPMSGGYPPVSGGYSPAPTASPGPAYPTESEQERSLRERRLSSRYGSPMPLPPGASAPPRHETASTPVPVSAGGAWRSPSPSPSPKPAAIPHPTTTTTTTAHAPASTVSTALAPSRGSTITTSIPTPTPTPPQPRVPESYLEMERKALERRKQEEADAELAMRLAAETEEEVQQGASSNNNNPTTTSTSSPGAVRNGAGIEQGGKGKGVETATVDSDEEFARRLARELNSDVLERARRASRDGSGHGDMPGGW